MTEILAVSKLFSFTTIHSFLLRYITFPRSTGLEKVSDQISVKKTKSHQIYQNSSGASQDIFAFFFIIVFNSQYSGLSKEVHKFFLSQLA